MSSYDVDVQGKFWEYINVIAESEEQAIAKVEKIIKNQSDFSMLSIDEIHAKKVQEEQ